MITMSKIFVFKTNLQSPFQNCFFVLGDSPENALENFQKDLEISFQPELAQKILKSITSEGKEFDPTKPNVELLNELYETTTEYFTPGN